MPRSMVGVRLFHLRISEDVIQSLLETLWRVEMTRLSRSAVRDLMEHLGIFLNFKKMSTLKVPVHVRKIHRCISRGASVVADRPA